MNTAIKTWKYKNRIVSIISDESGCLSFEDVRNPKVKMVMMHKRYALPNDLGLESGDYVRWEEVMNAIKEQAKGAVIFPLYMYDHSGLSFSLGDFRDKWDSGQVGFIWMEAPTNKEEALKACMAEVSILNEIENGEVFACELIEITKCVVCGHTHENVVDAMHGIIGMDGAMHFVRTENGFKEVVKKGKEVMI